MKDVNLPALHVKSPDVPDQPRPACQVQEQDSLTIAGQPANKDRQRDQQGRPLTDAMQKALRPVGPVGGGQISQQAEWRESQAAEVDLKNGIEPFHRQTFMPDERVRLIPGPE